MKKILLLGCGMVGRAMAQDMAQRHHVIATDRDASALKKLTDRWRGPASGRHDANPTGRHDANPTGRRGPNPPATGTLEPRQLDVTDTEALRDALREADLVISAVPGVLGYRTLQTAIKAGRDIVDISFFPENALNLQDPALENNVTAIVDCGVAPGMGNLLLGYHDARMTVTSFECLVGGLPVERRWPFSYKAPFSPADVIEEYVRPARLVENGAMVTREALSDPELIDFDRIGTLEAFNTDGLRTLIHTMPHIPDMKEKTLRYPGHIEYIRMLRACGFFSGEKVRVDDGTEVAPLALTSKLLFDQWQPGEEEEEFTVMRVTIEGSDEGTPEGRISGTNAGTDHEMVSSETGISHRGKDIKPGTDPGAPDNTGKVRKDADPASGSARKRITYDLLDRYCPQTRTSSMARTTGYTATAAANLLLDGLCPKKGVLPPERFGSDETCFRYIMDYLTERGVHLTST
ncbi:MAG: saccharopine dehydrogenase C-terminal domain-containing protein [Cyclonatronaceae bacterium]